MKVVDYMRSCELRQHYLNHVVNVFAQYGSLEETPSPDPDCVWHVESNRGWGEYVPFLQMTQRVGPKQIEHHWRSERKR